MVRNRCIRQNWKIFNRIKFNPIDIPLEFENDQSSQEWSEKQWNHITCDELTRHAIYNRKTKETKYTITLWTDDEYIYLVQVIRTEFNTDDTLVYMAYYTESNLSDLKGISKFINKNIMEIVNHSKNAVIEANKLAAIQELKDGDA